MTARATAMRLDDASRGRNNNLKLIRLVAAVGVVYGHAFGTGDRAAEEPFFRVFATGTGDVSVNVFFVISGFLVTKSFLSKSLSEFAWARMKRIYPALWVSTVLLVLVCGLLFSPLSATTFWSRPSTLRYLAKNIAMTPAWGGQITLPCAFDCSVAEFNTPLWTLPFELQMYLLLAMCGIAGWLRSPIAAFLIAFGGAALFVADAAFSLQLISLEHARFLYFFFVGVLAYLLRAHIPMRLSIVLVSLGIVGLTVALTPSAFVRQASLALVLPYLVLWCSFIPAGVIRLFNRLGDYSYGTYILADPIQVLLGLRFASLPPLALFALALAAVAPLAILSWHGLESKALARSWYMRRAGRAPPHERQP
jgi:peptidoglycan/LPS O-acetylase OafA/YrhL